MLKSNEVRSVIRVYRDRISTLVHNKLELSKFELEEKLLMTNLLSRRNHCIRQFWDSQRITLPPIVVHIVAAFVV